MASTTSIVLIFLLVAMMLSASTASVRQADSRTALRRKPAVGRQLVRDEDFSHRRVDFRLEGTRNAFVDQTVANNNSVPSITGVSACKQPSHHFLEVLLSLSDLFSEIQVHTAGPMLSKYARSCFSSNRAKLRAILSFSCWYRWKVST